MYAIYIMYSFCAFYSTIYTHTHTVSGSGISWAICKSAPRSKQTTTPAPHHSVFFPLWMPFLLPNQQRQSTGMIFICWKVVGKFWFDVWCAKLQRMIVTKSRFRSSCCVVQMCWSRFLCLVCGPMRTWVVLVYWISGHSNVGNRLHHCCVMSLLLLVSVNTAWIHCLRHVGHMSLSKCPFPLRSGPHLIVWLHVK